MTITEQEILAAIKEMEREQKEARAQVAFHKKAAVDAESRLIAANLGYERLVEKLRVLRLQNPVQEEEYRERDIREFRERLPEITKKIK